MSLYAAIASAIAAFGSLVIAIMAWKISKRSLHADVRPILKLNYKFGDKALKLENKGKGPALNIRLQKSQVYFIDEKVFVRFSISKKHGHTLYEAESSNFEIVPDKKVNEDDPAIDLKDLALFRYIESIGKNRLVAIIYDDIYGQSFVLAIKMIDLGNLNYIGDVLYIKKYSLFSSVIDEFSHRSYRIFKRSQERIIFYMNKFLS